jgi:hypothetical protein
MKLIKPYNTVINENVDNTHLLTDYQMFWCKQYIRGSFGVNENGEVYSPEEIIAVINSPDRFAVKFANCISFSCQHNANLVSLEGSPNSISGSFNIFGATKLRSLIGGPRRVGKHYSVYRCNIKSLEGAPERVGGTFNCAFNTNLESLQYSPSRVGGAYIARHCESIINLKGISEYIREELALSGCKSLRSLDGLYKEFDGDMLLEECGRPENELIYNWKNDITGEELDTFNDEWTI